MRKCSLLIPERARRNRPVTIVDFSWAFFSFQEKVQKSASFSLASLTVELEKYVQLCDPHCSGSSICQPAFWAWP